MHIFLLKSLRNGEGSGDKHLYIVTQRDIGWVGVGEGVFLA